MRNLARFIAIASLEAVEPQAPSAGAFTFYTIDGLSQEAFVEQIVGGIAHARGLEIGSEALQVSTESQQQDLTQQSDDLKAQYNDLLELLNPTVHTGSVQVFLLDEAGMASGHAGSAAALKALVRASMRKDHKVVAALTSGWRETPVEQNIVVSADALRAHRAVLKNYLTAADIKSFESLDTLTDYLSSL
jgi:hypothetical protein